MKLLLFGAIFLTACLSVQAQIPQKFNYQAIVRGIGGRVIASKPLGVRFSIRDGSATGTVQYSETQLTTTNAYGLVNLQVGAGTAVTGSFGSITWNTGNKFLEVEIDTTGGANYVELATTELVTVPYALQAGRADSARAAKTAAGFSGVLAGDVAGPQNATVIQAGTVVKSINGLKDGVVITGSGGTSISVAGNALTVNGASGTITGVAAGSGLTGGGTSGAVSLAVNYGGDGNLNFAARADHTHAGQFWTSSTGNTLTLQTSSTSFNSSALELDVVNTSSQSAALFAQTLSTNSNSAGVVGQATGNGTVPGVEGIALGNNTYAILGSAQGAGSYAGVFSGNVVVTGTLSKGAGSFKIDHPLDPANKYLSHSFVESPDMMNIYNGNIVLDGNGEATVTMPDWFEALNKDFRYQLTAIGKPSPNLFIASEISGNHFSIAGGAPGAKVSWTVTGIRHDAYANAHRIPVEELKPAAEKGKYLNPQEFGMSAQQGVFFVAPVQPRQRVVLPEGLKSKK